ncbi:MAG TPA: hypothetical protein VFO38_00370 [Candidatus Saccharimonadales bacterium]|nr:hypothetical protein [Candidatus Saccharimonadales bacterium]
MTFESIQQFAYPHAFVQQPPQFFQGLENRCNIQLNLVEKNDHHEQSPEYLELTFLKMWARHKQNRLSPKSARWLISLRREALERQFFMAFVVGVLVCIEACNWDTSGVVRDHKHLYAYLPSLAAQMNASDAEKDLVFQMLEVIIAQCPS